MRTIQSTALAIMIASSAFAQDTPTRPPTSVGLSIVTVYSDGQSMQTLQNVPDTTKEAVVQSYVVTIP